jgi:hypothetical protein
MKKIIAGIGVLCLLIVFSSCPTGPRLYPRIVIDTFPPVDGMAVTDTTLRLYDSGGTLVAQDDNNPAVPFAYQPSARIDYASGLSPGTYYIRVNSDSNNWGEYVIRVLELEVGESLPAYVFPGITVNDGYPDGDDSATGNIPDSPNDIDLGNANQLNKDLDSVSGAGTDVDWLRVVLP